MHLRATTVLANAIFPADHSLLSEDNIPKGMKDFGPNCGEQSQLKGLDRFHFSHFKILREGGSGRVSGKEMGVEH